MKQRIISLPILLALAVLAACSHGSSSSSSTTTTSSSMQQATAAPAEASPASSAAAATTGSIPTYPGSSAMSTETAQGAQASISTTDDSFDTVYNWYKAHLPASSYAMRTTTPTGDAGAFKVGSDAVTIGTQGGRTIITITTRTSQ